MAEQITPKQQAAIRFLVGQNPGLREEACRLATREEADRWISGNWRQAMTEGTQYRQLFIPRVYVRTTQEQTNDGQPFQKLRVTIPKGVRLRDGTDIGGMKLAQSLSEQYRKQLATKGRSITVYIPADRKVRLYRPGPEPGETLVDPDELVRAIIRHRDERKQAIQNHTEERTEETHARQPQEQEASRIEQLARQASVARGPEADTEDSRPAMTPEDAKAEAEAEETFRRVARLLGISPTALQVSGRQKVGYLSFRLAVNGQPGEWTPWQTLLRESTCQSMRQTLIAQSERAGIRTNGIQVTPKMLDDAGRQMAEHIQQKATDSRTQPGKFHLDRSQLRSLAQERSRESEFFRPRLTEPGRTQPQQEPPAASR